jgi:hypothetical protein
LTGPHLPWCRQRCRGSRQGRAVDNRVRRSLAARTPDDEPATSRNACESRPGDHVAPAAGREILSWGHGPRRLSFCRSGRRDRDSDGSRICTAGRSHRTTSMPRCERPVFPPMRVDGLGPRADTRHWAAPSPSPSACASARPERSQVSSRPTPPNVGRMRGLGDQRTPCADVVGSRYGSGPTLRQQSGPRGLHLEPLVPRPFAARSGPGTRLHE